PFVPRVKAGDRLLEPPPRGRVEPRQHRLEVGAVLVLGGVLRLEQEDDLGPAVRDAVVRPRDHPLVREPYRGLAAADPHVSVRRLPEEVDMPLPRSRVAHPGLMRVPQPVARLRERRRLPRAGDEGYFVRSEDVRELVEARVRNGDLEVVVLPALAAEEEVDRPTGRDVPGEVDVREKLRDLLGPP